MGWHHVRPMQDRGGRLEDGQPSGVGAYMAEVSRILTALGLVIAAVGLNVYGIAVAFYETVDSQANLGIIMMIGGVIAAAIGIIMSKQIPEED